MDGRVWLTEALDIRVRERQLLPFPGVAARAGAAHLAYQAASHLEAAPRTGDLVSAALSVGSGRYEAEGSQWWAEPNTALPVDAQRRGALELASRSGAAADVAMLLELLGPEDAARALQRLVVSDADGRRVAKDLICRYRVAAPHVVRAVAAADGTEEAARLVDIAGRGYGLDRRSLLQLAVGRVEAGDLDGALHVLDTTPAMPDVAVAGELSEAWVRSSGTNRLDELRTRLREDRAAAARVDRAEAAHIARTMLERALPFARRLRGPRRDEALDGVMDGAFEVGAVDVAMEAWSLVSNDARRGTGRDVAGLAAAGRYDEAFTHAIERRGDVRAMLIQDVVLAAFHRGEHAAAEELARRPGSPRAALAPAVAWGRAWSGLDPSTAWAALSGLDRARALEAAALAAAGRPLR